MNYCGYKEAIRQGGTIENRMKKAGEMLGITWGDCQSNFDRGRSLANSTPRRTPMTSINHDRIFDFYDNYKSDFEIITFLAFAGIRSILQMKPYTRVTNDYLIVRMAGYNTTNCIEDVPPHIKKYNTRYKLDKIKSELQNNWHMKLYGKCTHGFYVSFKLSLNQLVKAVESKREVNLKAKRQDEIRQALKEFETELKTTP